jgi:hypothetical protein
VNGVTRDELDILNFREVRLPIDVILVSIRRYVAYPLSNFRLKEIIGDRGVLVVHSIVDRWRFPLLPLIEKMAGSTNIWLAVAGSSTRSTSRSRAAENALSHC